MLAQHAIQLATEQGIATGVELGYRQAEAEFANERAKDELELIEKTWVAERVRGAAPILLCT